MINRWFFSIIPLCLASLILIGGWHFLQAASTDNHETAIFVAFPNNVGDFFTDVSHRKITPVVPTGISAGLLTATGSTGASNNALLVVGDNRVPDFSQVGSLPSRTASGPITENTVWNEDILVTGDVVVGEGVSLTINAGVTVFFAAGSDDQMGGGYSNLPEIQVYGSLTAVGTPNAPIYFISDATTPQPADWGGFTIYKQSPHFEVRHCGLAGAQNGFFFWNQVMGGGETRGTVSNCHIKDGARGVYIYNRPGVLGGTHTTHISITHNLITQHTLEGVSIRTTTGSAANSYDRSYIFNNQITDNQVGIYLQSNHWGTGEAGLDTIVRNNYIADNVQYGLQAMVKDGSKYTYAAPLIEHNWFGNSSSLTNTHILLGDIAEVGTDNVYLTPVIRYNSFTNGAYGVFSSALNNENTAVTATISHNIFLDAGEFGVVNISDNTVVIANDNYWGTTPIIWDNGPSNWLDGNIIATTHLDAQSIPLITYLEPAMVQAGQTMIIHGANFTTVETQQVYLPLSVR